ncbi:hypothetical protein BGZ83_000655 [Gryganskiella cystojenkinii]|nr:hypothetical protein BGZ83_000655 [Gryganskiella cystojenkinii]
MASSLSRKRTLQDLFHHSSSYNPENFPSLFTLAIQASISALHIFGSLQGLTFHPFGKALLKEFQTRATQWRLTTEQRQVGILLFAEAYGPDGLLRPEYSGLRCSLPKDIPHLGMFSECLVYLDLSGGRGSPGDEEEDEDRGFMDADLAGLSGLYNLKILNLAGLSIGDTGLSHLIRSVTFGSSGPALLEYLNLSGTLVTDVGAGKLFKTSTSTSITNSKSSSTTSIRNESVHREPVFQRLLGVDLTGSRVHDEVAKQLFKNASSSGPSTTAAPWRRLDPSITLFPNDNSSSSANEYKEDDTDPVIDTRPMSKWSERLNRVLRIRFGQRPDLAGEDDLGLAECLALSKLGQVMPRLLPDHSPTEHEIAYRRRGEEIQREREARMSKKNRAKLKRQEKKADTETKAYAAAYAINDGTVPLETMYNLTMYQRVMTAARTSQGNFSLPIGRRSGVVSMAFVRDRAQVEVMVERLEMEEEEKGQQLKSGIQPKADVFHPAKIRNRNSRPTATTSQLDLSSLSTILNPVYKEQQQHRDTESPIPKRIKTWTPNVIIKQEASSLPSSSSLSSSTTSQTLALTSSPFSKTMVSRGNDSGRGSSSDQLPSRRRNPFGSSSQGGGNDPFAKPAEEQRPNDIFIKSRAAPIVKTEENVASSSPERKKVLWGVASPQRSTPSLPQQQQSPARTIKSIFGTLQPSTKVQRDKNNSNDSKSSNTNNNSITRHFNVKDPEKKRDSVNLDRWIRVGAATTANKIPSTSPAKGTMIAGSALATPMKVKSVFQGGPTPVIRFDPKNELFADDDNDTALNSL